MNATADAAELSILRRRKALVTRHRRRTAGAGARGGPGEAVHERCSFTDLERTRRWPV